MCKQPGQDSNHCAQNISKVRGTVMRDFFDILKRYNLYFEELHLKSTHEYFLNDNRIEFISLDQPTKIRGRKRDLLFINEANELTFEDWQQLIFRTTERIVIDYNPSEEYHWIYDKVLTRSDVDFYQTTYKDNPFLNKVIVQEIERLKEIDENYWRVYGLGERGKSRPLVFNFNTVPNTPPNCKTNWQGA